MLALTTTASLKTVTAILLLALCATTASAGSSAAPGREARVVNGLATQERPSTGALLVTDGTNYRQVCTGTLVGCHTFVTAAHCVCNGYEYRTCGTPRPSGMAVYLQHAGVVNVAAVKVHPSYRFGTAGDIAVLTLAGEVEGVTPTPVNLAGRVPFGTPVEIVGFGVTRGGWSDSGMLRRGMATTGDCLDVVNGDAHVCWHYTSPLGVAGEDSNTCYGDSGGPLFAETDEGTRLVGVTSGGVSGTCLPTDISYDTDVYAHREFLLAAAGDDLFATACGSEAVVGEAPTVVASFDFERFSTEAAACRKTVAKAYSGYVKGLQKAMQACFNAVGAGAAAGPCPDGAAAEEIRAAAARVSAKRLATTCSDAAIASLEPLGGCTGATNASQLAACILEAGDAAVARAMRVEYADENPTHAIADRGARACQQAVATAGANLLRSVIRNQTRCEQMMADGKIALCPDPKTTAAIERAKEVSCIRVAAACTSAELETLENEGGFDRACAGITDAMAFGECQAEEHASVADELLAVLGRSVPEPDYAIEVPDGATRLVVTLNGMEYGTNDLDLYARHGAPATLAENDARSTRGGMFESLEVESPAAGTWYLHFHRYAGIPPIPFQLTATAFHD